MSYSVNKKNGPAIVIQEGQLNTTSTELTLIGKDYFGYGEIVAQNFVDLLENFASDTAPTVKNEGMLWFDTANDILKIWKTSSTDVDGVETGNWLSLDPAGNGPTTVRDTSSVDHDVWIIKQDGAPVAAFSSEADFSVHTTDPMYAHFYDGVSASQIKTGITLSTATNMKFHGTATTAQYADLAEMYSSDADYEPGTVVKIGGEAEVTQTTDAFCTEVFGVVSTNPAYLMNSTLEGTAVAVALAGRVPCKVIGEVKKGQRLVASEEPGVARAATGYEKQEAMDWNRIIGRALEDKTTLGVESIEVVVGAK